MFEGIFCRSYADDITTASYRAGDVIGRVSFSAQPGRTCVLSAVGPDAAVLECVQTHRYSAALKRHVVTVSAEVVDLS
jgi:hypothetical protein